MRRSLRLLLLLTLLTGPALAQQTNGPQAAPNPLVRLLQSKGIITEQEALQLNQTASPAEAERRLAKLLLAKGVIDQQEYNQTISALGASSAPSDAAPQMSTAAARPADLAGMSMPSGIPGTTTSRDAGAVNPSESRAGSGGSPQQEPKVVPAVAPLRVLPITVPKKEGLIPDIKLGSGARLRPYGFFKISAAEQTASHGGRVFGSNDFPQGPLLLGDTGPDGDPQFHIKDRALRLGVDFEWPDVAKNLTLTGKLEFDFEGNFTNVNNRNISANRSSQPSLRLAWVRLDTRLGDTPVFVQFGQDWSIFGSSTLMDLFETTGFGFAQGNLYERMPMFRTGVQFGKGDF
ncbi:MAG TPA: hypothetical protein VJZ91_18395, partial [Blastocatellia bacterium]|nr:hypothetical protein [Blastocatellia bacterium]